MIEANPPQKNLGFLTEIFLLFPISFTQDLRRFPDGTRDRRFSFPLPGWIF